MKKRIAYVRVSTDDQLMDSQRMALDRYFAASGIESIEYYFEYGSGGSTRKRPMYNKLMSEVSRGLVSHIYVYKLDRFSRNTKDFLVAHEEMERCACKFVSVSDNLDFSTPVGRMFAQMLSIFAEFERGQISARTRAGLAAARARGVRLGNEACVLPISEIRFRKRCGVSVDELAREFGLSRSQLYRRLKCAN